MKEEVQRFAGKKILAVEGNTKTIDKEILLYKKIFEFKSWGKHFLICFKGFTVRTHFLLFGSCAVATPKDRQPRLHLRFTNGDLFFYSCSVKMLEGDINDHYDWSGDVMNLAWDKKKAKVKIKAHPDMMVCDTLLHQDIFAGVGNIIKNEVLYRIRVHPESINKKLTEYKLNNLIKEARQYSFDFLAWKRKFVLKKHWLAHTKKICIRCKGPIVRKITGKFERRSFFCPHCQPLYS
ncbi:MAG: endonuclease [Saprospiraceae bacterium]